MPYPRSRSYATPEETFGITQKPLNAWFDAAASGMTREGPAFSASFEDATLRNQQRELESERLRREMDSEQAASAFLQRAAGEKPDALMQMIAEDPAILGSKDAPMIRDYIATRQQVQQQRQAKQPYSNKVLGPALMKQLEPEDQAAFAGFMEQGMEATEALQQLRKQKSDLVTQAERRKLALAAAEEGVDAADIEAAMASPDPDLYLAAAKGKAKRAARGGSGDEYSLKDLIDIRKSSMDDFGEVIDPDLKTWVDEQIKLKTVGKPPAAITNTPAAGVAKATPEGVATTPPVADLQPSPLSTFEKERQELDATKQRELAGSWTTAKDKVTGKIPAAEGMQPQRLVSLAQMAITGKPIEGVTTQEKQLAERMSQFAIRAAENTPVKVLDGDAVIDLLPGTALLRELGVDPSEIIEIPGAGLLGSTKRMRAGELMNLRLKEIAQPLLEQRATAATMQNSEQVKNKAAQFRGQ